MEEKCIFCESKFEDIQILGEGIGEAYIKCPICGHYKMSLPALGNSTAASQEDLALFSGYLQGTSTREAQVTVDNDMLVNIADIVAPFRNLPIEDKINSIIRFLAKGTKQIGNPVNIGGKCRTFYLKNEGELNTLIDWMKNMGLVKWQTVPTGVILEAEGWQRYDRMRKTNITSKQVFIAMSFDEDLNEVFIDAIEPACLECGFEARRVDSEEHNEKICDRIIAGIRESRFIVSDFTQNKQGVYFEAGYAQGMGLPVIWTCREDDKDVIHFDTRQYNHIIWKDPEDLKKKLIDRIKATIK